MGEVWLARDHELELSIAVKLLHPHLAAAAGAIAFMKNECRAARRLTHPNIVRVYDFHQQDDLAFISMEWIEGPTFDCWPPVAYGDRRQPLLALRAVADALEDIHRQGLVHRDVKARNILMTTAGRPKLTDFGIVGLWRLQPGMLDVRSGGTQASMSPQQREGRPPEPADDIYAFGVLLQEILTGTPSIPAHPQDVIGLENNDTQAPAFNLDPPPQALFSDLLPLATQMQATAPRDRPASMRVVKQALEAVLTAGGGHGTTPPDPNRPPMEAANAPPGERIAAQPYTPASQASPAVPRQRPVFWSLVLAAGAIGLIAAGIWGIGYLARHPLADTPAARPLVSAPPPVPQAAPEPTPPPSPETTPTPAHLQRAEKTLAQWLMVRDKLDTAKADTWAPETATKVAAVARQADAAMMDRNYTEAAEDYAAAAAEGQALLANRKTLLGAALQAGQKSLQADKPDEARAHFSQALKIEPDNAEARQGLTAADRRVKVLALMTSGEAHEKEGRYDLALTDYESTLALDPSYPPARRAVERLKDQTAETQYNRLVSEGLNAFYQNRFSEARRRIEAALAYRPDGHEAREALHQINVAAREQQIAQLRHKGQAAETGEQWARALKAYEAALAIDPGLRFAGLGAVRSRERIRLEKRLRYYLENPDTLASDRYLGEARAVLDEARAVEPRGPRLGGQIQALQAGIKTAQTRIPVTVLSDGQTEVAVLRVARLGRITHEVLELRPGTYTIVGSRDGYRDVRQTIRIAADQQAPQVSIACKEKI
jgi:serine/threonine protein kinase/tetratricopeptide (TPR) repeat protein